MAEEAGPADLGVLQSELSKDGFTKSTSKHQVLLMSVSFCFVFMSFSVAQNFASSREGSVGSNSVGMLYVCFSFATLASSGVVKKLKPRLSLVLGTMTYGLFVAANIPYTEIFMYPAAILLGIGAAVTWTANGTYISICSHIYEILNGQPRHSSLNMHSGMFFAIFQVNQGLGNLLAALLFHFDLSVSSIFTFAAIVSFSGTLGLFFLKHVHKQAQMLGGAALSRPVHVLDTLGILTEGRMQLLIPLMVYSGLSQGFIYGQLPALVDSNSSKFFVMSTFGFVNALSGTFLSRFGNHFKTTTILRTGMVCHLVSYCLLLLQAGDSGVGWYFAQAILLGVGDSSFNTQLYFVLGSFFKEDTERAFAALKLFQASSTASSFFLNKSMSVTAKGCLLLASLFLAACLTWYLHARVATINAIKTYKPLEEDQQLSAVHASDQPESAPPLPVELDTATVSNATS